LTPERKAAAAQVAALLRETGMAAEAAARVLLDFLRNFRPQPF